MLFSTGQVIKKNGCIYPRLVALRLQAGTEGFSDYKESEVVNVVWEEVGKTSTASFLTRKTQ
jgi:hypothetical protein